MSRWVPPPRRSATPLVLALAGTLLAACTDARTPHAPLAPDDPNSSLSLSGPSSTSGIDPNDTNYTLEVVLEGSTTIDSPVEIIDPVSGVSTYQWTVDHEPETLLIDVGYDAYGREVQDLRETGAIGDPVQRAVNTTRRTWSVGEGELTRYDRYDNVLPNDPGGGGGGGGGGGECPRCIQPTGGAPVQITDGMMLDAGAVDALSALSATAAPLAEAAGPHARVERAGADRIRITNDLSGGSASESMTGRPSIQPEKGEYVRSYRRSGDKYVLEEAVLSAESKNKDGGSARMRQVERIRLVRFHENAAKDQQRRAQQTRLGVNAATPQEFDWPVAPAKFCLPDEPPGSNCTPPPPPPPEEDLVPPSDSDVCTSVPGSANVLLQHGIMSSGDTWTTLRPGIICTFKFEHIEHPSINWLWSIESQRDELRSKVPAGMQQIVLIGHSNGGLVSRSYAQWAQQNQPGRVRGVVTLDSPNQGAVIARNAKALEHTIGSRIFGPLGWWVLDLIAWHPFYEDDVPQSAFLRKTNGFNESFTRVGIQTHTPKRWVAWRILATPSYCAPETNCGERAVARKTQENYDHARHYSKFWYRPWQSVPAGLQMMLMNGGDAIWNTLTAPGPTTPSDGFIDGAGQIYPRAQRNRLIPNGDSHVGTTRSSYVQAELSSALADDFHMQKWQP